jgi:mRNA interferase MazF
LPDQPYCPDAGDIVWLQFDPQAGREQAGRRPALVLSPRRYNQIARLCVLCPITNTVRGWNFETLLPDGECKTTGAVLSDQVKSLSWEQRQATFIEHAPSAVLADVRAKVKALIGL